jgi:hypothetical protein
MARCGQCTAELDPTFRFCPHCGHAQRTKIVEWFRADPRIGAGALRVSVYLTEPQHVRFSIWKDGVAQSAVSLDPPEGERLAGFLRSVSVRREARIARSLARLRR